MDLFGGVKSYSKRYKSIFSQSAGGSAIRKITLFELHQYDGEPGNDPFSEGFIAPNVL